MAVSFIAFLSVGALALSYIALTGVGSDEHPGLPVNPETVVPEESIPFTPPPSADTPPEPAMDPVASSTAPRLLAMVGSTAMRATSGTCEDPGTVEISVDGAQSWSPSETLPGVGATQVLRLLPTDPSLVQIVALDENCEPKVYRSNNLGTSWEGPLPVLGTWYFDPSIPAQVGAPRGTMPLVCEGAELAAAGDRAAVRCLDGSVITTVDRGITWSETTGVTDVLAISYSPDSYVMVQPGDQTCQGLRLVTLAGDPSTRQDGCFETEPITTSSNPENIAIAQSGMTTLLWVEDDLATSTDGGKTWL